MLDKKVFESFILKVNQSCQQFYVWMYANNEFAKHQEKWNKTFTKLERFLEDKGCKYKNFWDVVILTLQQAWKLGIIRLFDPSYFSKDVKKENPRLSLCYISELLEDDSLKQFITEEINKHSNFIESIKKQRPSLAHNDTKAINNKIEAGVENLFEGLDKIITEIKNRNPHLKDCNDINRELTEKLSKSGVDEIFEALLEIDNLEKKEE